MIDTNDRPKGAVYFSTEVRSSDGEDKVMVTD